MALHFTQIESAWRAMTISLVLVMSLFSPYTLAEDADVIQKFNLAPGNLANVLLEFAQQAELQLLIDTKNLKSKHSKGVQGNFSQSEALDILLADVPLAYEFVGHRTLVIRAIQSALLNKTPAASSSANKDKHRYVLDEVLVTSRRVLEDLQKIPLAVSAFNHHDITTRGAKDLADISVLAPNVHFESAASFGGLTSAPTVFIRAIGQADFLLTADPAVGVYLDGVFVPRSIGSMLDLINIDRVEVLRGPQGTLFGRNSVGGAINLITRKPHDTVDGEFSLTLGNDQWQSGSVSLNLPLTKHLYAGLSMQYTRWDGWVDATQYDDYQFGEKKGGSARLTLRLLASDALTVDLTGDVAMSDEAPAPFYAVNASDSRGGNEGPFPGSDSARFNDIDPAAVAADCTNNVVARQTNPVCIGAVWTQNDPFRSDAVFFDRNGDKIKPDNELNVWGLGLNLEWVLNHFHFKSISGYREVNARFINDLDQTPHPIFQNTNNDYDNQSFSQELQVSGSLLKGQLDYIAGLYYFKEKGLQNVTSQRQGNSDVTFTSAPGFIFSDDLRTTENSSNAAYLSTTWHLQDWLHLTAGLRWTDDNKKVEIAINRPKPLPLSLSQHISGEISFTEVDPLLTLGVDFSESVYSYLTYSEGFRDGGFPTRFIGDIAQLKPFDAESVQSLEVGFKSTLFDNRLRFNLALFHTRYNNFQVVANPPVSDATVTFTENLAKVAFSGLEVELFWLVSQNVRIDLALGRLDNRIKDISKDGISSVGFPVSESNELPYSPRWNWNLGVSRKWPLAAGDEFEVGIDWHYVDDQYFRIENPVDLYQEAYNNVDLNIAYRFAGGHWELKVGARNLTNAVYSTAGSISSTTQLVAANTARPRVYYATTRYFFNE